ncbi:precorrin-4 C(11)-methyltransferase [Natronoflexus pectinivorans]|uniref:Precorrin-4 C11-methyltransferase n=1 Tax=Natronoflexus pectinivorans TaxID=682526 RepID=A0A4R2GFH8_9BACT|nr:precorrin-4 C(11)-methyltransferase [Natronoflexus pectinivorans]TCO06049.1 precorrin-4 C11-methyltransferase [Natronoflexus pectinivorans]
MQSKIAIVSFSNAGSDLALRLCSYGLKADCFSSKEVNIGELFNLRNAIVFIGALGICVRQIAPFLKDKVSDPAIINIDVNGHYVQPVTGGHRGGANQLAEEIAALLGAIPIITTVSDTVNLWPLDLLPKRYNWVMETGSSLTKLMAAFVNEQPTALLLEARDNGTLFLEESLPEHVTCFFDYKDIDVKKFDVIIAVTPYLRPLGEKVIYYRPKMLHLGMGCQKDINSEVLKSSVDSFLIDNCFSPSSIASVGSVELKKDEKALNLLAESFGTKLTIFSAEELASYDSNSPSEFVNDVTGTPSVSEAAAFKLGNNLPVITKHTLKVNDKFATISLSICNHRERKGFVEIVGAGPGDPLLITVRGKMILQTADLILYAGSLVPVELTHYAKKGCTVRSSAGMDLPHQIELMKSFADRGLLVARLHTGDPCIYGAIQEQMAELDKYKIPYRITPGVSSFQAAAAALKSQFTIPDETQTIILTRGEGRTPVPEKEQLNKLAQSQSTLCIFLSATLAEKVQQQLLEHYPANTPVAICHKLTWKDEKLWHCDLINLAETVAQKKLTLTTLIVVGKAINNREGLSRLYAPEFKHLYR